MRRVGVLGGMGPAATLDFMSKLLALTPAERDQDHLPVICANLPQIPDRTAAILGRGEDPLPSLLRGIAILNEAGVELIAIPCSTSHHWYAALSRASRAPILHIAPAAVARVPPGERTLVLATRGALHSGLYQRELAARCIPCEVPDPDLSQSLVDDCIRLTKSGQVALAGAILDGVLTAARARGIGSVLLGCTELPLAARYAEPDGLQLIDCTLELARRTVACALDARPGASRALESAGLLQ